MSLIIVVYLSAPWIINANKLMVKMTSCGSLSSFAPPLLLRTTKEAAKECAHCQLLLSTITSAISLRSSIW